MIKAYYYENCSDTFFIDDFRIEWEDGNPCDVIRIGLSFNPSTKEFIDLCERRLKRGRFIPNTWVYWVVLSDNTMELRK